MHLLDISTILLTTLMGGNELAVSLFINPALWKLDDRPMIREFAASLGKFMPFWYAGCLLLLLAEVSTHWHQPARPLLIASACIWLFTIAFTIAVLVPINNRLAAGTSPNPRAEHKLWDTLHRARIALLLAAILCLLVALNP